MKGALTKKSHSVRFNFKSVNHMTRNSLLFFSSSSFRMKADGSTHYPPHRPPLPPFPLNVGFRCSQVTRSPQRQLDHALQSMSFDLFAAFEGHGGGHHHGNPDTWPLPQIFPPLFSAPKHSGAIAAAVLDYLRNNTNLNGLLTLTIDRKLFISVRRPAKLFCSILLC